jgi:hypothetical protein
MTDSDKKVYRDAVPFWREAKAMQTFEDLLTDCLLDRLFLRVPRCLDGVRIIGRNLVDYMVRLANKRPRTIQSGFRNPRSTDTARSGGLTCGRRLISHSCLPTLPSRGNQLLKHSSETKVRANGHS